jgi:hypothetical protein
MKSFFILIAILCFAKISFAQKDHFRPEHSVALDMKHGKQLLKQCSRGTPENVGSFFVISAGQIKSLEDNFKKVLKLKPENGMKGWAIDDMDKYGYQYIGLVIHNKKYIYINAFNYSPGELKLAHLDWKVDAVNVCGGGTGWWGVLYNLDERSFSQLQFNASK